MIVIPLMILKPVAPVRVRDDLMKEISQGIPILFKENIMFIYSGNLTKIIKNNIQLYNCSSVIVDSEGRFDKMVNQRTFFEEQKHMICDFFVFLNGLLGKPEIDVLLFDGKPRKEAETLRIIKKWSMGKL